MVTGKPPQHTERGSLFPADNMAYDIMMTLFNHQCNEDTKNSMSNFETLYVTYFSAELAFK